MASGGRYLAVANNLGNTIQLYSFGGNSAPVTVGSAVGAGTAPSSVAWSPNGGFIAVTNYSSNSLQVFNVHYTSPASPQAFSSAIVFGDSGVGSSANLNVRFLGGASVNVNGSVNDDGV